MFLRTNMDMYKPSHGWYVRLELMHCTFASHSQVATASRCATSTSGRPFVDSLIRGRFADCCHARSRFGCGSVFLHSFWGWLFQGSQKGTSFSPFWGVQMKEKCRAHFLAFRIEAGSPQSTCGWFRPQLRGPFCRHPKWRRLCFWCSFKRCTNPKERHTTQLVREGRIARWWRKQVGFVGQEPILFNASVLENVAQLQRSKAAA